MPSEPIAQISDRTVGRSRAVGTDENGSLIEEKIPSKRSVKMLDPGGSEVWVAVCCHRVPTRQSEDLYGRPNLEDRVQDGFLPKDRCPLTQEYRRVTGKVRLAEPLPSEPQDECLEPGEHGCVHYQRIRDERRAEATRQAASRDKLTPEKAQQMLIQGQQRSNEALVGALEKIMTGARGRQRRGESD